ncbi:glutaredoxin family protein [Patescibacteria group bacterium]|nr:MAG: glutaredoxin family protein [Patescibacteria group bacterium]
MSITIYSTPTCPYCIMAKNFFKKHDVAYNEKDVAADQMAAQEMIKKSGQMGVPVIEVDGEIIIGFDEAMLKKILKISV